MERGYNVAVAGIPKTIDNDGMFAYFCIMRASCFAIVWMIPHIPVFLIILQPSVDYIDHSFGFSSAVEAACLSIRSAKTEAVCNLPNVCHPFQSFD